MVEGQHHHRSTLKQKNKPFKSKHSSKSELKDKSKGKVARQSQKSTPHSNAAVAQHRVNRKNAAKQAQLKKRQALVNAIRIFNGVDGTPRIVAVVPLTPDVSPRDVACGLAKALDVNSESCPERGLWRMQAARFKTSLQFILLPHREFYSTLDACKAADYVVFAMSDSIEVDPWGDTLLRTLQAQGLPSVVSCMANSGSKITHKDRPAVAKSLQSFISYFVPSQTRVFDLVPGTASSSDSLSAVRALCEGKPGDVRWREGRPWVLAENVEFVRGTSIEQEAEGSKGTLKVTGVVRGIAPLDVNRLIHVVGCGDFQVEKITSAPIPSLSNRKTKVAGGGMDVDQACPEIVLAERETEEADSLVSTNEPDDMAGEQTWPTEDEMAHSSAQNENNDKPLPDAVDGTTPKSIQKRKDKVKRKSMGVNDYMASWIIESDGSDDDEDEDDDEGHTKAHEDDVEMNGEDEEQLTKVIEGEDEEMDEDDAESLAVSGAKTSGKTVAFEDLDDEEEAQQLKAWLDRPRTNASDDEKKERDDAEFPDEIDTPRDIPARERFARYRGLRSLRTSPWDPYENLPKDFGRVFSLEGWRKIERAVKRHAFESNSPITAGQRVTIHIRDFSEADAIPLVEAAKSGAKPVVLFGLFEHEHKMTVLNFAVQRNTEYDGPVKSKDSMILCYGPRRLRVGPIYSQLNRGGGGKGANNVHKFERWLRNAHAVATTYAPICFGGGGLGGGGVPCTLLRENVNDIQAPILVAMGAFLNADTTRIVVKRILLTGHPFKVHKKTATVRYMFFNPDDVSYFKPVQLHTKYGRTGHIRASLGTHGYYKAHFDGPINQMDTVCMALYKRVYPRWPSAWRENRAESRHLGAVEAGSDEVVAMEE